MKIVVTFDVPDIDDKNDAEFERFFDTVYSAIENNVEFATNVYVDVTYDHTR